jgi:hypothetical protein
MSATILNQRHLAPGHPGPRREPPPEDAVRMPRPLADRALGITACVTGLLALAGALGALASPRQFAFSYLTGYAFAASIGIGSLFWLMIHHVVKARWSVVVRRLYENLTLCLPALVLLFLPVALSLSSLYGWADAEANGGDALWLAKRPYLNAPWFIARAAFYLLCWAGLAWRLRSWSVMQDESGGKALNGRMAGVSGWGLVVLALTSTYAAFDWMMSLDYRWYSTMYGVYFWSGAIVSSLAALTLAVVILHAAGWLRHTITEEHLHDLGKLLFSFIIFWAYIAFSQYMLIWYANLSDETPWYVLRLQGGWQVVAVSLMIGHFVVPFVVLLSRRAKRSWLVMGLAAAWVLVLHYVDLYWLVMPALHPSDPLPHWLDFVSLLFFVGVLATGLLYGLRSSALVPAGDPRLSASLSFHQE